MIKKTFYLLLITIALASSLDQLNPTHSAIMTIEIDGQVLGDIEISLFGQQVPSTVQNFAMICSASLVSNNNIPLTYENSKFHRIIPNFMIQGGDFTRGDGTGGESIYGEFFDDQNFQLKHEPYCLSMANKGPNTNGSQFFITVADTYWLNGKHVVFGKVKKGLEIVKQMQMMGTSSGQPKREVRMISCAVQLL